MVATACRRRTASKGGSALSAQNERLLAFLTESLRHASHARLYRFLLDAALIQQGLPTIAEDQAERRRQRLEELLKACREVIR